jgi:Fe-S cluster biosynthesis and repair protein YggX
VKTVFCSKYQTNMPGLEKAPFAGSLGQEIFDNVSQQAYSEWLEMQIKVINEYRLNLADIADQETLLGHMKNFFGLSNDRASDFVEHNDDHNHAHAGCGSC